MGFISESDVLTNVAINITLM